MDRRDGPASFCVDWKQGERHEGLHKDARRILDILDDFSSRFDVAQRGQRLSLLAADRRVFRTGADTGARRYALVAPALANVVDIVVDVEERVT